VSGIRHCLGLVSWTGADLQSALSKSVRLKKWHVLKSLKIELFLGTYSDFQVAGSGVSGVTVGFSGVTVWCLAWQAHCQKVVDLRNCVFD